MKIARLSEFVCGGLMVVGGLYILYSTVTRLRRKLDDSRLKIKTVQGLGYLAYIENA